MVTATIITIFRKLPIVSIINDVSELDDRFGTLLKEARNNDEALRHFQAFELALMATDSAPAP